MSDILSNLTSLEKQFIDFGFAWPDKETILAQIVQECAEIKASMQDGEPKERLQEEIGDIMHAVVSLCLFAGFEVEETLRKAYTKVQTRFTKVEALTRERHLDSLHGQSHEFILELWNLAKKNEDS